MDFVQEIVNSRKNSGPKKQPGVKSIGEIISSSVDGSQMRNGYVDLVLSMVRYMDRQTRMLYQANKEVVSSAEKRRLSSQFFEKCVSGIKTMQLNNSTMRELLVAMDCPENTDIKRKLWTILFSSLGRELSSLLSEARKPIYTIEECASGENGDISIFWLKFRYVNVA